MYVQPRPGPAAGSVISCSPRRRSALSFLLSLARITGTFSVFPQQLSVHSVLVFVFVAGGGQPSFLFIDNNIRDTYDMMSSFLSKRK